MQAKQLITQNLLLVVGNVTKENIDPDLKISERSENGDYYTNVALKLSSILTRKPIEIASTIKQEYEKLGDRNIAKIEVAPPGFINFFLSRQCLRESLLKAISEQEKFGQNKTLFGKKIMVEFAHPNTHKEFHIGHLRNITLGESICRLIASQGASISRVNYQGDVGMHVAKALYGIKILNIDISKSEKLKPSKKAEILGKAYAAGSKAYEENEKAKKQINEINKQIYARDKKILPLWKTTRQWSLEYFEFIYKRVGTRFDRLFFESEVYEEGKKVVLAHIPDGIFAESDGAIIFPGEKYGLHNRVFVTSEGNSTYEGKEMGLGPLQYKEFKFDEAIHVVGPEQAGYFDVVFKALELIDPVFKGREKHLSYGFVRLRDGKMSSRLGNIIRGEWLLDEAKKRISKSFPGMDRTTCEAVAIAAVKYSMLRVSRTSEIQFSFEESISLEGNSGPYIQYAYVRTQSILEKAKEPLIEGNIKIAEDIEKEEEELVRAFNHFPERVVEAARNFAPNLVANYLFELSQKFNLFYQKHPVLSGDDQDIRTFRIALTAAVGQVLKNGLTLLGIETVERM